jgi:hypothetical protein
MLQAEDNADRARYNPPQLDQIKADVQALLSDCEPILVDVVDEHCRNSDLGQVPGDDVMRYVTHWLWAIDARHYFIRAITITKPLHFYKTIVERLNGLERAMLDELLTLIDIRFRRDDRQHNMYSCFVIYVAASVAEARLKGLSSTRCAAGRMGENR